VTFTLNPCTEKGRYESVDCTTGMEYWNGLNC